MKKTKLALFQSVVSLLLCLSMLVGTTFAWFTDAVTTGINTIAAGTLDVELYHSNAAVTDEQVDSSTKLFMDLQGGPILWEPGVVSYENLRITNAGDLALAYQLAINTDNENYVLDPSGAQYGLSQILKVGVVEGGITATERAAVVASVEDANWTTLADFVREGNLLPEGAGESEKTWGIVIWWEPGENDNYWNLNNGKQLDQGEYLMIDLGIRLIATQEQYESDSFGNDYDSEAMKAVFPNFVGGSASVTVVPNDQNQTSAAVTMADGTVAATVPAGVQLAAGVTELKLNVTTMGTSGANIALGENEAMRSLDVHIEGIADNNTVPITVTLKEVAPIGLNMGNYKLYHVEDGKTVEMTLVDSGSDFTVHNQFKYDPATGDIILYMATFSEVAVVADTTKAWNGGYDHSWYTGTSPYTIANADQLWSFSQIVGGMAKDIEQDSFDGDTVKLISDINLDDAESSNKNFIFYPIGYYNSEGTYEKTSTAITSGFKNFEGTFDGQGHTISNFYQNTWEMKGDNEYYAATEQNYRDGMGLFGKVYGGTVKNLTVANFSSDGEYTTTGVIAAYADSANGKSATFENIAIVNCNPRVYNIGNGGIVGCGGWYSREATDVANVPIIFKNITVDKTNKISALWGSWDVACGGIMGQYYPNSGCGVKFENCNMAAQIDVYNDVCANYQYYAYRYAGMMIGSIRNNLPADENGHIYPDMTGITASNCTVNYGDWNDYYYCEFVDNSIASYTHDYQFSRVDKSEIIFDENGNITGCTHDHAKGGYETTDIDGDGSVDSNVLKEDKTAVYLPFSQLFTGYGWGVTSKGLEDFAGIENITITESEQNESVEKFETKFTGDFLYRVGNANTVSVGSLFDSVKDENGNAKYNINDSGVYVRIDKVYDNSDVTCTFTAAEEWENATLKFEGTGVVDIVIQDYDYCTPTVLHLEVVDAQNTKSAMSATANSVVLLNDVSGSFSVYNGHTLYGNGFTVTLPTTSQSNYSSGYVGYVTMNDGNLDNVRIEGPDYPEMNIYREQAKDSSDATKANYFYNSLYINGGNCTINNSYISGSRTAICIRGGNNVTIDNTTVSGGAVANIEVAGASSVTLRDVTTVQTDANTVQGMGVYVTSGVCKIYIEGELTQRNWINQEKWKKLVGDYDNFFPDFFGDNQYAAYQKNINGVTYVNLAMIFACNWDKEYLDTSKQNNKADYTATDGIALQGYTGGVYSVTGIDPTADDLKEPDYQAGGFSPIIPTFNFDNSANHDVDDESDAADTYCVYDKDSGTLKVGVTGDSKAVDLSGISVVKNGVTLMHTAYLNGTQISSDSVTVNVADGTKQTLTFKATGDSGYDKDGNIITGEIEYTWTINIEIAVLAYPAPVWNMGGDYQFDTSNCYYAYYQKSQGYGEAVPIYEGVKVNYYNKSGTLVELDLSGTTTLPTGSNNANANAFTYTLSDGSTLTMKFSSGWKSGATTHQFTSYDDRVYLYPQSLDNDNYVRAETTNQDFNVKLSYRFTDPNGQSTETVTMNWYNAAASNGSVKNVQWKTFDSTNGKEPGCVTGDTLVTLADGSQKRIDEVTYSDNLLVWDFFKGEYAVVPAALIVNHGYGDQTIIKLTFDDGTVVKAITAHAFFDADTNKWELLNSRNAHAYIGHAFVQANGVGYTTAKLIDAEIYEEYTESYSLVSAYHYNFITENMFSLTNSVHNMLAGLVVGENMTYDQDVLEADVEKYGVYTYNDFADYITYQQYIAFNGDYLKISVEKGFITFEEILALIKEYL